MSVTRADGTLTASWDAPAGATSYHVTYSSDGGASWSLAALNHPDASITFAVSNGSTYVVGVRARNAAGDSGWRNSPASGPFTPPPATPTPTPPGPVAGVTVTRADGTLTASWDAVANAASYHVTYTSNGGWSWSLAALNHSGTSIEIGGVDNAKTYVVGARARNASGDSGWRNSAPSGPFEPPPPPPSEPPLRPSGLTATAGDGSVALTWDGPGDASISGYEYRVRWAGVAWGAWTSVAGNATSVTVTGLENGVEYRFKLRAVNAAGASKPAPAAAPWYVAATPAAPTLTATDPTPTSAVLTLGGYGGEWHYRVTGNSGGGGGAGIQSGAGIASGASGQSGQTNCIGPIEGAETTIKGLDPDSSYTINAYVGGCGGGAIASSGAQTLSAISLAAGTLTTVGATLTITGHNGSWWYGQTSPNVINCLPASGATATITGQLPGRAYTYAAFGNKNCHPRDNTLATASFTTRYGLRADEVTEDAATLVIEGSGLLTNWWYKRTAPSGDDACRAVTFAHKSVALDLNPSRTYSYSAYVDSACAAAVGSVSFKTPGLDTTLVTSTQTATLNIRNWTKADGTTTAAWWYEQTAPSGGSCMSVAEGTSSVVLSGVDFGVGHRNEYVVEAYGKAGCEADDRIARTVFFPGSNARGGVEDVAATTATFLAFNAGDGSTWGYGSDETGAGCFGPYTGVSRTHFVDGIARAPVTGLTPGTAYTFSLYRVIAPNYQCISSSVQDSTVTFTTASASVSNLDEPQLGSTMPVGWSADQWVANAFTTGTGASEFTVKRITILLGDDIIPAPAHDLKVRLFNSKANGDPGTAVPNAALTGPARPSANAEAVYECAGSGCDLDPGTTYFVVLSVPDVTVTSGLAYRWQRAATERETSDPPDSGFGIANEIRHTSDGGTTWMRLVEVVMFGVEYAMPAPALTASDIAATTATLTLENEGGESAWYAKRTSPSATACSAATASGGGLALTGLTENQAYTYVAYRDSACKQVVASGTFTTVRTLTASNVTDTTATLTLSGSGNWYAKYTSPTGGTCSTDAVSGGASLHVTDLSRSTTYTYKAYSDSACATEVGTTATFTTEANWLTVSGIGITGATLTLTGVSSWYYQADTGPDSSACQGPVSTDAKSLTGLTKGATYTYTTYSDSGCATTVRSVTFKTFIDAPTNATYVTADIGFNNRTTVTWRRNTAATGAVGYEIQGRSAATRDWVHFRNWPASTSTATYQETWQYGGAAMNYIRIRATQGGYHSAWVEATNISGN